MTGKDSKDSVIAKIMKKYSELTVITKAKELEDCRIYRLML